MCFTLITIASIDCTDLVVVRCATTRMSSLSWHRRMVFVYGTLKMGQPNNSILQTAINMSQAKFLGRATTVDCWPLIVYSTFNIPYLLDCKGTGKASILLSYHTSSQEFGIKGLASRFTSGVRWTKKS